MLGIQGCQGSGKSTLASFLQILLEEEYQLPTAVLSLDDFYLTLAARKQLADSIHPLLLTRGVPGTHDLPLALKTFKDISQLKKGQTLRLPRFDKAQDDRAKENTWPEVEGPIRVIIFEGWCVGVGPQSEEALTPAINELEQLEDGRQIWRKFVNKQLATYENTLFNQLDKLVVLQAPSFACVYEWRALQEKKLREKTRLLSDSKVLSDVALKRFIAHYERLSRHCLASLPAKADWLFKLNENQKIYEFREGSHA